MDEGYQRIVKRFANVWKILFFKPTDDFFDIFYLRYPNFTTSLFLLSFHNAKTKFRIGKYSNIFSIIFKFQIRNIDEKIW